jgi:hypothetical protein
MAAMRRLSKTTMVPRAPCSTALDQRLRVHHERAVAGEGDRRSAACRPCRQPVTAQVAKPMYEAPDSVKVSRRVVLDDLETVGLHVAGVEELDRADLRWQSRTRS